jgi:hypothetical protein
MSFNNVLNLTLWRIIKDNDQLIDNPIDLSMLKMQACLLVLATVSLVASDGD